MKDNPLLLPVYALNVWLPHKHNADRSRNAERQTYE
jgi:hypothetical protein